MYDVHRQSSYSSRATGISGISASTKNLTLAVNVGTGMSSRRLASGQYAATEVLVPSIDSTAFVPHGELAKHEAGKPVEFRRGRATVIDSK
jgi:hypothetical protein